MPKFILITLFFMISCAPEEGTVCMDTNCADYSSQEDAQLDFDANRECREDLDADKDGKACEQHFRADSPSGDCPKTSNCGCSGKKKDVCNSDCCQWIVGTGCKCR